MEILEIPNSTDILGSTDLIVKVLGLGMSGLGFLLMYLAYRLINSIVNKKNVNSQVIKAINRYMLICFVLTIAVGFFTFITSFYKNKEIAQQSQKIEESKTAINLLTASQQNNVITENILNAKLPETVAQAKQAQKEVLDSLTVYINKTNNSALTKEFSSIKRDLLITADSLSMESLSKSRRDSLKKDFLVLKTSINQLSLRATNGRQ